ncbi:MAG TPA: S9 family peptidase [Anaeromyxobacteraceae bacterium]|nr:S9 family peptidase [Anaeromyxobacteraceae bacterium]
MPTLLALASVALAAAGTHPFSVHDMLAMDRISDPRPSPDGKRVAFTVRSTDLEANKGRKDVWLAAVDGSWTRRLTTHEADDFQARWSPDGRRLYFLSTRSGSSQVWRLDPDGGEAEPVTRLPLDVEAFAVAPTGKFLVLGMSLFPGKSPAETKALLDEKARSRATGMAFDRLMVRHWDAWRDGTRNHLFAYDLGSGAAADLMRAMDADCPVRPFGGSEDFDVSPDGRTVVFAAKNAGREEAWSTNLDLFSVPADGSAAPRKITDNPAADSCPVFSPDGRTLAFRAQSRPGYESDRWDVVVRDLGTGRERRLTLRADASPAGDRSAGDLAFSRDGRVLYATAEHLGQVALFGLEVVTGATRTLTGDGTCVDPRPLPDGRVAYGMQSLLGPTELFVSGRDGKDPRRITRLNDARLAAARLGAPERFSFAGARGETVHGYLVRPADFDARKKVPVAFLIHGGPQGSFGNDFHYRWNPQAYAGAGYAVVMVDFHGSTGYGQAFTDSINGDWGGAPLEDLLGGLEHALSRYPFLDRDRVAALGASFGCYMVNWLAGKAPDRFKALVCHDGNLDERMAYFDTEELWFPEWEHGGTPWQNPAGYARHNPIDLVGSWKAPMLVIHGQKDFRVVYTHALGTFTALQRRGIPSKLLLFPDENHWVLKPHNSIQWHETVLGWLDRWLRGPASAAR